MRFNINIFSLLKQILPSDPDRVAAAFQSGYYHSEFAAYREWLPELKKLKQLRGIEVSDVPLKVAEPYFINLNITKDGQSFGEDTAFVLQDLRINNYRMNSLAATPAGIDYAHAKLAVETYANFHALSIARLRQLKKPDGTYELSQACQVFRKNPNTFIDIAAVYRTVVLPRYGKILRYFNQDEVY